MVYHRMLLAWNEKRVLTILSHELDYVVCEFLSLTSVGGNVTEHWLGSLRDMVSRRPCGELLPRSVPFRCLRKSCARFH